MMIRGIHVNNAATPYSGVITEVNDTEVTIRITGRLGIMKLPLRAVLGMNHPKAGDEVTFLMSLVEIKSDEFIAEGETL